MAITIIGQPPIISPVFNPVYFYVDSDNKTEPGFKYVVDVRDFVSSAFIARYEIFPRPVDGYGVSDIQQVLSSQLSYDLNVTANTVTSGSNSYFLYDIQFGESYIVEWEYNNFTTAAGNRTRIIGLSAHTFVVGDYITVYQDQPSNPLNDLYSGVHKVISATTTTITIDVTFQGASTGDTGVVRYSNNARLVTSGMSSSQGFVFNGAIPHNQYPSYSSNTVDLSASNPNSADTRMLTNVPQDFHLRLENDMWLNGIAINWGNVDFYDIITDYGQYRWSADITGQPYVKVFPLGPNNIINNPVVPNNLSGSFPIFKDLSWEFTGSTSAPFGETKFLGATAFPTGYTTGEYVQISQYNPATNLSYNGLHQISSVNVTGKSITINVNFGVSALTEGGLMTQKTDNYSFATVNNIFMDSSRRYRFVIDDFCSRYDNIELLFIDRMGSFVPANFQLQSSRKININKSEYQSVLGGLQGNKWGYNSIDRGRHQINTTVTEELLINSNWITEQESIYYQELYSSPLVYIRENGEWWPVIVKETDYNVVIKNNKKNIRLTMTVSYANNNKIQQF